MQEHTVGPFSNFWVENTRAVAREDGRVCRVGCQARQIAEMRRVCRSSEVPSTEIWYCFDISNVALNGMAVFRGGCSDLMQDCVSFAERPRALDVFDETSLEFLELQACLHSVTARVSRLGLAILLAS